MKTPKFAARSKSAVLTIAEIKAAIAAFDRGETNVFDALDSILVAFTARPETIRIRPRSADPRKRAA